MTDLQGYLWENCQWDFLYNYKTKYDEIYLEDFNF